MFFFCLDLVYIYMIVWYGMDEIVSFMKKLTFEQRE